MANRRSLSPGAFARFVKQAIEQLLPPYAKLMESIAVVIERNHAVRC